MGLNVLKIADRASLPIEFVLRALAVVDAVALPSLIAYGATRLPNHGGLIGSVAIGWMVYWGGKRLYRAVFEFDDYQWMAARFLKIAAVLFAISLAMRASYWITG